MDATTILQNAFEQQVSHSGNLDTFHSENWKNFSEWGLPAIKHEEWKYARIKNVFSDKMILNGTTSLNAENIKSYLLEGNLAKNAIVFINGVYNKSLSTITESENNLVVKSLSAAAEDEDADAEEPAPKKPKGKKKRGKKSLTQL